VFNAAGETLAWPISVIVCIAFPLGRGCGRGGGGCYSLAFRDFVLVLSFVKLAVWARA